MTTNDFYVAIQGILMQAHLDGWRTSEILDSATDAIDEWYEEADDED